MESRKKNKLVQPLLKWAGGKRQLLKEIKKCFPKKYSTYHEPFLGGGAVLFDIQPKKAFVNDVNSDVINVYRVIKEDVNELIEDLKTHKNESDYYYKIRELDRTSEFEDLSPLKKASRIIYLNKTCYNGLFRVNSQNQFNVPFGKYKNPNIVNEFVLRAVSQYLNTNNITIWNKDFEEALQNVHKDDFVYIDPPYDPVSDSSSFTGYTLYGFDKNEQIRLKNVCDELNRIGCKFLLSNSATSFIRELYKDYQITIVGASRAINSVPSGRGKIEEVLVRNYE
ncbi:MAG: DNA adenine methylase [Anaerolineae bacterium]|nr:DNA adenine methylase [Anaerolineae bacterium]